jgi:hypothetical protein
VLKLVALLQELLALSTASPRQPLSRAMSLLVVRLPVDWACLHAISSSGRVVMQVRSPGSWCYFAACSVSLRRLFQVIAGFLMLCKCLSVCCLSMNRAVSIPVALPHLQSCCIVLKALRQPAAVPLLLP